ncbi:hypothetical protein ACFE04_016031 [Oxalis oulophora]
MSASRTRETISECLSELRSNSEKLQQKALRTLLSITKVSPQNRNLLSQRDGTIPILLELSKLESSVVQYLALSVLFNLSLNPDLKQSLASTENIRNLNFVVLLGNSPESCKLASSVICSLAILDKNKAKFGVAGTIQVLLKAISGPRGPTDHHLLSSLAELVQFHGNCTLAVRSGAVKILFQLIQATDAEELAGISLAILGRLARFNEGLAELKNTEKVVNWMLEVLKGRCMLSKEGACEILVRLFNESEGCLRDALRLPEFSNVVADISVRGSSRAREKASDIMKMMMEANLEIDIDESSMFYHV